LENCIRVERERERKKEREKERTEKRETVEDKIQNFKFFLENCIRVEREREMMPKPSLLKKKSSSSSLMMMVKKQQQQQEPIPSQNLGACVIGIGEKTTSSLSKKGVREALEKAEIVAAFSNRVGIVTRESVQIWTIEDAKENEDPTRTNVYSFKIPKRLTGARMIVTQLSLGIDHGAYLTSNGVLFTFGKDRYGQLGHDFETCKEPRRVRAFSSRVVSRVCCGHEHTMAIAEGQVFVWGRSKDGRLGLGSSVQSRVGQPRLISELRDVRDVAAGKTHSLALVQDGRLYAWGWGPDGQLGLGEMCTQTSIPKLVPMPSSKIVTRFVSCSERYSTAIVFSSSSGKEEEKEKEDGVLMAWGSIWQPQKITRNEYHTKVKVSKRSWTPALLPSMPKVSRVVCGTNHLLYVSGKRRHLHVTAWGRGAIEISSKKRTTSSSLSSVRSSNSLKGRVLHVTRMHRPLALNKNDEAFSARHIACGKDFALCTVIPCSTSSSKESNIKTNELARTLTKEEVAKFQAMKKTTSLNNLRDMFVRMAEQFETKILDQANSVCGRLSNQSRLVRLVTTRLQEDRENDDVIVQLREENNRLCEDMKNLEETSRKNLSKVQDENESVVKQNQRLEEENARLREQIARFERLQRENTALREDTERRHGLVQEKYAETQTREESLKHELELVREEASHYQKRVETMEYEAAESSSRVSEAARDSLLSVESQHERRRSSLIKLTQALEIQQEAQEATLSRLQEDLYAQREMHSMMNEDEVAHEQMLAKLLPSLAKLEEDNNELREIARCEESAAHDALDQARREHTEAVSAMIELEASREEKRKMLESEIRLAQDRDAAVCVFFFSQLLTHIITRSLILTTNKKKTGTTRRGIRAKI